jgi:hypothetical protein
MKITDFGVATDKKYLLQNLGSKQHVALDTLRDFEKVIAADEDVICTSRKNRLSIFIWDNFYRIYRRMPMAQPIKSILYFSRWFGYRGHMIKVLMGPSFGQCMPNIFYAKRRSIYLFDAWEESHALIEHFAKSFAIDDIFFSSLQVAEKFRLHDPSRNYHWVPEGIEPIAYRQIDYDQKDIDVLQLGRKYDAYHNQIVEPLQNNGYKYYFEMINGEVIFPTRDEFVQGLARAKISICVPSNITHPARSGSISTMTNRYLQSMASKCLVVGIKPAEMDLLFDYNPIVEIDLTNPFDQLQSILSNYQKYIPLIERNYENVCRNHSWSNRWEQFKKLLHDDTVGHPAR